MQDNSTATSNQNSDWKPPPYPANPPVVVPTPDNPPWESWMAIGVWAMSVIFVLLIPSIFLFPYLARQNVNLADGTALTEFAKTDLTAVLIQILAVFPAHGLTLLVGWLVVTQFRKYSFRETLGWNMNGFKLWHSVVITVAFFFVAGLMVWIFGDKENDFEQMLKSHRVIVFPVAILATFTAPLVEEVVYRGLLYSAFQRRLGVVYAVVLTTFLFAIVHVPQYSQNFIPDYATVTTLFLLSLTLTMIRVYTKNLLPCVVLHTIFNGIQSVALIVEPYLSYLSDKPPQ